MKEQDYIEKQKKFECNNCPAINCINKSKNQKCKGYCTGDYWGKKEEPFLFDGITVQNYIPCKELLEEKQMVKKEKCTSEEWDHCRVEKMGCTGCYYNENALKEAIKIIKNVIYDKEGKPVYYIDISFSQYEGDIGAKELIKAIETVLQALENSIPKKKIEDKIKELWKEKQELQDKYDKNIDKWIEEGKKAANEHKDRLTPYIPAQEEIGIRQKIQYILGAILELEKIINKF